MAATMHYQGRAIAEQTEDGWMLMLPDGTVSLFLTRDAARRAARKWASENTSSDDETNAMTLEWRDLPNGAA